MKQVRFGLVVGSVETPPCSRGRLKLFRAAGWFVVAMALAAGHPMSATAGTHFTPALLSCLDGFGYFISVQKNENLPNSPSAGATVSVCRAGTTVDITDLDANAYDPSVPYTYKASSKITPNDTGKKITIATSGTIRRANFASPMQLSASAGYQFTVPDVGTLTTPVRLKVKRKAPDLSTATDCVREGTAYFYNLDTATFSYQQIITNQLHGNGTGGYCYENLSVLSSLIELPLVPGNYLFAFDIEQQYSGLGTQDPEGFQPPFSDKTMIQILVPKQ